MSELLAVEAAALETKADASMEPTPATTVQEQLAREEEDDDEKICRYCFDGEEGGPLIAPCECKGGQRWVHLECLRRWQRMVLVSQPTHPMFHGDELRHQACSICKTEFTCAPPTRHELMTSFTGPEIAALIDVGCVIAAGEEFSAKLDSQLRSMPVAFRAASSYEHWLNSAYLITDVEDDNGLVSLDAETDDELTRLRAAVDDESLVLALRGKRLKLTARGSLADKSSEELRHAFFEEASTPATLVFEEVDAEGYPLPRTCGDDHVSAVNLCRPQPRSFGSENTRAKRVVRRALESLENSRGKAWAARCHQVEIVHHIGGPCDEHDVVKCLVLGATMRGYKVVKDFAEALFLAARLARSCEVARCESTASACAPKRKMSDSDAPHDDPNGDCRGVTQTVVKLGPGQRVCLQHLQKNAELNGKPALVIRKQNDRWLVRVADSENLRLVAARPEKLRIDAPPSARYPNVALEDDSYPDHLPFRGVVYAFWGDARWSRTQLLGEIARGHWGMCRESLAEIVASPGLRRAALDARLIFAPLSAMTEESIARARTKMVPLREQARLAAASVRDQDDNEEPLVVRQASSESNAEPPPNSP